DRCHYFSSFPHHITFAPHIRSDLEILNQFGASTGRSRDRLEQTVAPPAHVLSPAVCFHTYLYFADRALPGPQTITACGRCFRYEGTNFSLVERLWDFSLREIIFVGPAEWVMARRQICVDAAAKLCADLGLDAWIESANDPFFLNNFA